MLTRLQRSISEPIREGLDWDQRWQAEDQGLIVCWEVGRQLQYEKPHLAETAKRGELVVLVWRGGVEQELKGKKTGTLKYLAMWQGLRGEDLDLDLEGEIILTCTKTGQAVIYSRSG